MLDVEVIQDAAVAAAALDPIRSRLLAELALPASAATLAARIGLPRQKVNYHLRTMEAHGLVQVAEERRWGGLTERLLSASAGGYLISPGALGPAAAEPGKTADRLSASYLIAMAGRVVREVGALLRLAETSGKRLATASIDTEITFASPAARAAFAAELTQAMAGLAAKYHDEASGGRAHRVVMALHPISEDPA